MQSRMDKYSYNKDQETGRSNRNKTLYSQVYNSDFYTEIAELENTNEVDLSKVRELLKNREEYQKAKNYKDILGMKEQSEMLDVMVDEEEEKVYDVNSILEKARQTRHQSETYKRTSTEYDILKKLNLLSIEEKANDMFQNNKREEEKLRELIDTITMKKEEILDTAEFGMEFLDELKGETTVLKGNETYLKGDTTIINENSLVKNTLMGEMIVADPKKDEKTKKLDKTIDNAIADKIDKSFFTTSLSLSKNDFEDFEEFSKSTTSGIIIKILLIIVVAIVLAIGFFVYNTYINI